MKIVEVTWVDIQMKGGWHSMKNLDDFITNREQRTVIQIGYLYEENEDEIVLLDAYFVDRSQFGTIHTIPRGAIANIRYL